MELIIFFILIAIVSIGSFWLAGIIYGLIHRPSIYFPFTLAAKMAVCAVLGSFVFILGGVALSTLVFNAEMSKRRDYKKWPTILTGILISVICLITIYFSLFLLAWEILD